MKWGVLVVVLVLLGLALALAACGSSTSSTTSPAASPKAGGTYNYPLQSEPVAIDPTVTQESEGFEVNHQVFEGLAKYVVQPDGTMKTEPNLAESWDSPDGKVWTIKIKPGIMFQAPVSREVTAQDFVDDWTYNCDPKNNSITTYIISPIEGVDDSGYLTGKTLTGVKALDKYTLQVTLKYPFFDFPVTLGHPITMPYPLEYLKQVGPKAWADKPIGTGPYMVSSWVHNQSIDLVKNTSWWQAKSGQQAYVDNIHFKIYAGDPTPEFLDFQKGVIDVSVIPVGQVASTQNNANVKNGTWQFKLWPNLGLYYTGIYQKSPILGGSAGLPLRQALAYSADTTAVINVAREGVPLKATGYIPAGVPGFEKQKLVYPYDPAKAKALVAQIGTVPTLTYWFNTDPGHQKVAEALQAGWKAAGINVTLSNYAWASYLAKLQKDTTRQLWRLGWLADYPSMDNFLFPLFQSGQSKFNTYTDYANPTVDSLIQQARGTKDDTQRVNLYIQAEQQVQTDLAVIPIYWYRNDYVDNASRIGGFYLDPLQQVNMWQVWVK